MPKTQPIITLITDFGLQDGYVGAMKGVIANINPSAKIIDISNNIGHQDIFQAAYVLNSSYSYFPEGTIHVIVVDPGVGSKRKIICLKAKGHIFLAPDNGILSLIIAGEEYSSIREVTNSEFFLKEISDTFHGRDIFAPVAAHLSMGVSHKGLGKRTGNIKEINLPKPIRSPGGVLTAEIIYVDGFGNLITNINKEVFSRMDVKSKTPLIIAGKRRIKGISSSYTEVGDKEPLAIYGSSGYLEVSINRDSASVILNLKKGDKLVLGYE